MVTKLQKWGNSQGVRLPKYLLAQASFEEGDDIEITAESGKIILRPVQKPLKGYRIEELFAEYEPDTSLTKEDWGLPSGKEVW